MGRCSRRCSLPSRAFDITYLPIFALQPPSYVIGSGHGRALASSRARTQTSRTSSVVRITGMSSGGWSFQQGIEEAQMLPHEDGA